MNLRRILQIVALFVCVFFTPVFAHAAVTFAGSTQSSVANISAMPIHQAGDMMIIFAFRRNSTTPPTVPAGWTVISRSGGSNSAGVVAFKIAQSSSETSGTWSSASGLVLQIYRGQSSKYSSGTIPKFAGPVAASSGTTITYPGLTLNQTTGNSYILGFAGISALNSTMSTPPTGMVNRETMIQSNRSIGGHDTNGGVTSWTSRSVTLTTAASWRAYVVEIESAEDDVPVLPTVSLTAAATTVALNATTTLTWTISDTTSCTKSGGWSGSTASNGSEVVEPVTQSTLYKLACTNSNGSASSSVTVVPGITIDNVLTTNQGFQATAFHSDGSASTIEVKSSGSPTGYGVTGIEGSAGGASSEIVALSNGASELLRVIFDQPATSTQVQIAWSGGITSAVYTLYNASGAFVASGTIPSASDGIEPPVALDAGGASFSRIDFTALPSQHYLIHSILLPNGLLVGTTPSITSVAASGTNIGKEGSYIQLIGTSFNTAIGTVVFSGSWGTATGTISSTAQGSCTLGGWTSTSVCVQVPTSIPDNAYTATITLTRADGQTATAPTFTIAQNITSTTPSSVGVGSTITISGDHLCQTGTCPTSFDAANTIQIGGVAATFVSWSHTGIVVTVPSGITPGSNTVTVTSNGTTATAGTVTFVPPPTVSLTAATTTVAAGSATTLTWSSTNTISCTASGAWSGTKATSGTESTGSIIATATFTLNCTGIGGSATTSVTISTVVAPTVSLSASPTSVSANGTSTLSWSSTGAVSCTASGGWSGLKATTGTETTSTLATTTTFTIACTNLAGTATSSVVVTVAQPPVTVGYVNTTESSLTDGGRVGQSITITGTNLGTSCSSTNYVTIGTYTIPCASVSSWSNTAITFTIPSSITTTGGAGSAGLTITANGQTSAPVDFIVYPAVTSVAASGTNTGKEGSYIQLIGTSFGTSAGTVTFSGAWGSATGTISSTAQGSCTVGDWAATSVCVQVPTSIPDNAYTATITLTRADGQTATAPTFTIMPNTSGTAPSSGVVGDTITISGDHLCQSGTCPTAFDGANTITIGGVAATFVSWSHTGIVVTIPSGVSTGSNTVILTTGGMSVSAGTVTVLSTEPNAPSLGPSGTTGQFSGGTSINIGSATASSTITFAAAMSAQTPASLVLEVEVKPVGGAFDATGVYTSNAVNYTSTAVVGSVVATLTTNTPYHWRARVRNTSTNEVSAWVAFGSNPSGDGSGDGVPATTDFIIATDGPTLGGVGTAPNCSAQDLVKDTSARIAWTASSILTPIQNKVRVATSSNMANFLEYQASNGTSPQVTLTGLAAETAYFYQVLSQDSLGTESIAQESGTNCTFVTEEASKRINKLSEFYICQMHEQDEVWTGGSGVTCISGQDGAKTFNVFVSEMIASKPVVQTSAFVEVFGIAEASSDFTVTVNVNDLGPKTITVKNPQGSIPYRVLYHLPDGYNLDFPADTSASNLLDVQVNGADTVSSMGAKAILNYYYFPTY